VDGNPNDGTIFLTRLGLHPHLGAPSAEPVGVPGSWQVSLEGEVDVRYRIERSEDLSSWSPFITVTNVAGWSEVLLPTAAHAAGGFYRARSVY
jgi:hypothetical protein